MINHKIRIPSILEVGFGKINEVSKILKNKNLLSAIILFDDFMYANYNELLVNQLKADGINVQTYKYPPTLELPDLVDIAFSLPVADVIIGMGGGAIVDFGKYISYIKKAKYISIPTSASNDGFASANSSLMNKGKKTTAPARAPYGVIVDIDIVKKAPEKFILSGVGDLVSNITALYDWEFEVKNNIGEKDDFALMLSKKAVNSFVRTPFDTVKDDLFVKELIDSMVMGGVATEITGNSCPISGSEHLIAHALDKISDVPVMHGIAVGIATYIMSIVQNHRYDRIEKILTDTGFFKLVATLNLKKSDIIKAIDIAPSIKPNRFTYIHLEENRELAKKIVNENKILNQILK